MFFSGFDGVGRMKTLVILGLGSSLGIMVSILLKYRSTMVKVFAAAAHSPVEVIAAHFVLGTELHWIVGASVFLITVATYIYYADKSGFWFAESSSNRETPAWCWLIRIKLV